MNKQLNFAIFASGNGSNAQNIIEFLAEKESMNAVCVVTDNRDAYVIERCRALGTECVVIPFEKGMKKSCHEGKIRSYLKEKNVDWILLAGYMRILSNRFIDEFYDQILKQARIVNIHPSLLPCYPGLNSYERAFNDKVPLSGVTLHYVDAGIDTGKIILQKSFKSKAIKSLDEFKETGLKLEYQAYRQFLNMFLETGELKHELKN